MCCGKDDPGEGIFWTAILVADWKTAGMRVGVGGRAGWHAGDKADMMAR